jgi:predicted O-methyltransferase YrrM
MKEVLIKMLQEIKLEKSNRENVLSLIENIPGEPEMSDFESGFLSGLIKTFRPTKIVEIGIAAGGTTAIILDSLEAYSNSNYELYSLDLNNNFYKDVSKKTGFLALQYTEKKPLLKGVHHLITGKYAPESIDIIGDQIDFIIIDTVHTLPGEILDFLAFYPYLSNQAVVVLHDVNLHHLCNPVPNWRFATKLLFDVVVADKYMIYDSTDDFMIDSLDGLVIANIAAFRLNDQTSSSLTSIISSLSLPWKYLPTEHELEIYSTFININYDPKSLNIWNAVILQQLRTMKKRATHYSPDIKRGSLLYWIIRIVQLNHYLFKYGPFKTFTMLREYFGRS